MKKILIGLIAAATLAALPSFAGKVKDNCGCGLGVMALGDEDGLASQVVALTLNGICANQLFGIISGTLECERWDALARNTKVKKFVGDHMDHLIGDMASGSGDSLDAFSDLIGVPAAARPALYTKFQNNFGKIFTKADISVDQVLHNIETLI